MASDTPSAQIWVPVKDLVFPPPHLCSHYTTLGKIIRRRKKISGGVKIMQRRKNYPQRARVGQKPEKKIRKLSHSVENIRTVPKIPYSISLYIEPNYTLS